PLSSLSSSDLSFTSALHCFSFFFHDTAPTEIYPLSLHDALPISRFVGGAHALERRVLGLPTLAPLMIDRLPVPHEVRRVRARLRSEEHTSELQSLTNLVCRLLLEKKKTTPPHRPADRCRVRTPLH